MTLPFILWIYRSSFYYFVCFPFRSCYTRQYTHDFVRFLLYTLDRMKQDELRSTFDNATNTMSTFNKIVESCILINWLLSPNILSIVDVIVLRPHIFFRLNILNVQFGHFTTKCHKSWDHQHSIAIHNVQMSIWIQWCIINSIAPPL